MTYTKFALGILGGQLDLWPLS